MTDTKENIIDALREVYDPEIPISVYDLGLIYDIKVNDGKADILMTLTSPTCPTAEYLQEQVQSACERIVGEGNVTIELTFEPKWSPDRVSVEAKEELGISNEKSSDDIIVKNSFETIGREEKVCFNCATTSKEKPLIACEYKGENVSICTSCLSKF